MYVLFPIRLKYDMRPKQCQGFFLRGGAVRLPQGIPAGFRGGRGTAGTASPAGSHTHRHETHPPEMVPWGHAPFTRRAALK